MNMLNQTKGPFDNKEVHPPEIFFHSGAAQQIIDEDGKKLSGGFTEGDWCHVCGKRSNPTVQIVYPKHAIHGGPNVRRLRICSECGTNIVRIANEPDRVIAPKVYSYRINFPNKTTFKENTKELLS